MALREDASDSPSTQLRDLKPSSPYPDSALSYWHRTTRAFPHLKSNDKTPLPLETQYAIIGSGITGALTAYELLEAGISPQEVIILEAREAVSGSSGRNAGHVRPDACSGFGGYAAIHGAEEALQIVKNEKLVLDLVQQFVQSHDIDCEFMPKQTFDVCLTPDIAHDEAVNVKQYADAGGCMDHIRYHEGIDAKITTGVRDAVAAWEWPAASIHPAKLAQWLLSNSIDRGVSLFTYCPVTGISKKEGSYWNLGTPRGPVAAMKVIHCTNAYAGSLLPQLSTNLLTPIKVQVHSLVPTSAFSGSNMLQTTMALRYEQHRYYALTQNQKDGMVIFGVAKPSGFTYDDSSYTDELVYEALEKFEELFPKSVGQKRHGEGLDHAWSGLIAMTPDRVPYVGPVEGLEGQYVCAGFNGHGMARIFTCVPGLVKLIQGHCWEDTGLPKSFRYSQDRLNRIQ